MNERHSDLRRLIRDIPDFPREGILFRDITPLLGDPAALAEAISRLAAPFRGQGIDIVAAVEARGFIFGSAVAKELGAGFVPIRKSGKLPCRTESICYGLEYGQDKVEMHVDALQPGMKVLMVDDLLATGGTMAAACQLVERLGGKIAGLTFLIELSVIKGRQQLGDYPVNSVIIY